MKKSYGISYIVLFVIILMLSIYIVNGISIPLGYTLFYLLPLSVSIIILYPIIKNKNFDTLRRKEFRNKKFSLILAKIITFFFIFLLFGSFILDCLSIVDLIKKPSTIIVYNAHIKMEDDNYCSIEAIDNKNENITIRINSAIISKSRCKKFEQYLKHFEKNEYKIYYYQYLNIISKIE